MTSIKPKNSLVNKTLIDVFHYKRRQLAHELGASTNILEPKPCIGCSPLMMKFLSSFKVYSMSPTLTYEF